jgi:hypothetical protein
MWTQMQEKAKKGEGKRRHYNENPLRRSQWTMKERSVGLIKRRNKGSAWLRDDQMITGIYDNIDCCKKSVTVLNFLT